MKHIVIHIISILLLCILFTGCIGGSEEDDRMKALLDSARTEMLVNMDYNKSEKLYKEVIGSTRNKLLRLWADEGMMQLCQIRSLNKRYYDYRSDAQQILREFKTAERHIDAENDSLLKRARRHFYRVSAVYYITLRDVERMTEMIDSMHIEPLAKKEFLSRYLGKESMYYKSLKKVWSAEDLTDEGRYDEALDSLAAALHIINLHHQRYSFSGMEDTLSIYKESADTISTEMRWIHNPDCVCVPDWMATVREQLSITFGAMGNKEASDYNHNIYFDILDATRQDRQLEQQMDRLLEHESSLNIYLIITSVTALLMLVVGIRLYNRKKHGSIRQQEKLREETEHNISTLLERWLKEKGGSISKIQDEMEYADDERRAAEMKVEENKRSYIDKATSMSIANGIVPFLDRAIREVDGKNCDVTYLSELIDKINDYNDILGHWVKIRQGCVSLHIESFPLDSLFEVARKAQKMYETEGLSLEVTATDAVVKADKALTLFMINTLMDNARKFTPQGGSVKVYAEQTPDYVEISVKDTGYGMSEDDSREVITARKGHGFGLLNCRGIIEKYKKTNRLFSVCHFGVESKIGEGSRFFFRLPTKIITILALLMMPFTMLSAQEPDEGIRQARVYADSVYECNMNGNYARAIEFGDSVITSLNMHYIAVTGQTDKLLKLDGELRDMPEIKLWQDGFDTDYDVIISVRNEIAIAALAMNRKHLYRYNGDVFTRLYQYISQDKEMVDDVARLERMNNNKVLILNLSILLIFLIIIITVLYYYHQYILPLSNLKEVNELDEQLLDSEEDKILQIVKRTINDIITIDEIKILPVGTSVVDRQNSTLTIPLTLDVDGERLDIGLLAVWLHANVTPSVDKSTEQLLGMIASYLAIALYCTSTKIDEMRQQLEIKQDEQHRAEADRNRIHVQNMILDNCLSAIKHETMYYPTRIKQLIPTNKDGKEEMDKGAISELLHYYKEIFTVLSECAMKQLEQTAFKRRTVTADSLVEGIKRMAEDNHKSTTLTLDIRNEVPETTRIICDPIMVQYMFDALLSAIPENTETTFAVDIKREGDFCVFSITDSSRHWTTEQTKSLFYADSMTYDAENDQLQGGEYILCRQIIREHDDHCGVRGCRIYAEAPNRLTFTLPCR